MTSRLRQSRRPLIGSLLVIWAAGVVAGTGMLWCYAYRPGESGSAPAFWPTAATIARSPERLTLVMAAHPKCPCTRASIGELARIMRGGMGRIDAHVLFFEPSGATGGWAQTDLWSAAAAIPGVTAHRDVDGATATLFGEMTSGAVVVYDELGALRFAGGVTSSRGHEGDNSGRDAINELIGGHEPLMETTPVYGCRLTDESCHELQGANISGSPMP